MTKMLLLKQMIILHIMTIKRNPNSVIHKTCYGDSVTNYKLGTYMVEKNLSHRCKIKKKITLKLINGLQAGGHYGKLSNQTNNSAIPGTQGARSTIFVDSHRLDTTLCADITRFCYYNP